jgi:DNA-directed RNA polymerase subunit RPC12/RpoP
VAPELADVFRRFGPDYLAKHAGTMPPSHGRAIRDIVRCRTPAMGGHLYHCPDCGKDVYVHHGCRNRHCPACHAGQTREWLEARQAEILSCGYFHVTLTLPNEMRGICRSNQKDAYAILMRTAAEAVVTLCRDPRHLGATPALLAVLHTWTGRLDYHPHVHLLVSAGGIANDGKHWLDAKPGFLAPVKALSRLFRNRLRKELETIRPDLCRSLPDSLWKKEWVANILPWGNGKRGVLEYLARYVFRVALTNSRLVAMDQKTVTFRYKDRKQKRQRTIGVSGEEFMRRFLQHVLPKGFHKVRYYGLWHPANRQLAARVRLLLANVKPAKGDTPGPDMPNPGFSRCPYCGGQRLVWVRELPRPRNRGP